MKFCMQKYFCQPGKHTIFHQGRKGYKAKGHKVIKAGPQKILKLIFLAFYASVSPLHSLSRHNTLNITEPMEIAKCALQSFSNRLILMKWTCSRIHAQQQSTLSGSEILF